MFTKFMNYFFKSKEDKKANKDYQLKFSEIDKKRLRNVSGKEKEKLIRELKGKYNK